MVSRLGRLGLPDDGVDKPRSAILRSKHSKALAEILAGFVRGADPVNFGWLPVMGRPASARNEIGTKNRLAASKTLEAKATASWRRPHTHERQHTPADRANTQQKKRVGSSGPRLNARACATGQTNTGQDKPEEANRSLEKRNNPEDAD